MRRNRFNPLDRGNSNQIDKELIAEAVAREGNVSIP